MYQDGMCMWGSGLGGHLGIVGLELSGMGGGVWWDTWGFLGLSCRVKWGGRVGYLGILGLEASVGSRWEDCLVGYLGILGLELPGIGGAGGTRGEAGLESDIEI